MRYLFLLVAFAFCFHAAQSAYALEVGDAAPCVALQEIRPDGSTVAQQCVQGAESGAKYVLIEFFSTTCGACQENLPKVVQIADESRASTTTRLVGLDRDADLIRAYVSEHHGQIDFPVEIDSARQASRAYGIQYTPTVFIVGQDGKIVYKTVGTFSDDDMAQIRAILAR